MKKILLVCLFVFLCMFLFSVDKMPNIQIIQSEIFINKMVIIGVDPVNLELILIIEKFMFGQTKIIVYHTKMYMPNLYNVMEVKVIDNYWIIKYIDLDNREIVIVYCRITDTKIKYESMYRTGIFLPLPTEERGEVINSNEDNTSD